VSLVALRRVRAESSQEVLTNAFLRALAGRLFEFFCDTPVARELLADIFHLILTWLRRSHVRIHAATRRASLSNTSEKPVLLVIHISNTNQNLCDFNSAPRVYSDVTRNAVLVEHEGCQYRPSTLSRFTRSSKWAEMLDGAQQLQIHIASSTETGLYQTDSDATCTRHSQTARGTTLGELCDVRVAAIPNEHDTYSVTSFQISRDLGEEVGENYITSSSWGRVWCYNPTDGRQILATTSSVPSGCAVVCRAYAIGELQAVLRDLGAFTTSFDAQTGDWCVSLVDYSNCSTYSTAEPSLADAYGIVLLEVVEGRRHDGTG
jgi:hypothetical protein